MEDVSTTAWIITTALYFLDLAIKAWLVYYVPKRRKPTAASAWLLLIFVIPFFGALVFLIIGNTKLSKARRKKQSDITKMLHLYTKELQKAKLIETPVQNQHVQTALLAADLTGLMPTGHNKSDILTGYEEIVDDIIKKINKATSYVYVEFYILALDTFTEPFFEALRQAKSRGVSVYVLYDAWGSRKFPRYKEMQKVLTEVSSSWHKILPPSLNPKKYNRPDLRNHRKIVVVDNNYAYIGSLNMIDKTYHRKDDISYIELAVRLEGPSVNNVAAVFASDWYSETDQTLTDFMENSEIAKKGDSIVQVVPSGPGYHYQNNLKTFVSLIYSAKKSIHITNPYLVPDESLLSALISAARRGVEVSILNSEAMDQWVVGHAQRSYYTELLESGVKIYLYKKPQLVHEKFFSVDDEVGVIGSSNLDIRSFELNSECVVVSYDKNTAKKLSDRHHELRKNSKAIKLSEWSKRSGWQGFLDSVSRLTSALQ